ncbi:hypothetical protein [Oligosphaera ethanolica]|uniref:Uncharacterized protein n=1 Tax=Oligosphaera ethanolica TaxID=760260 RepID=A0AAE3VFS7_9BACT|nr:hypothetical protein [Oligosphaera ethanolica]MDQ0289698.1 hypothetical protein [Oligosphaera ethanolica]
MKRIAWGCFGLLLLTALTAASAAVAFPVKIHAGTIEKMERLETPLAFVKLGEALAAGDTSAPEIVPAWLREDRPAPEGQVYVVFTVAVLSDRSLSRFDYALAADGQQYPCLGLALEQTNVFDERRIEQRGAGVVKLAFACPATASDASLVSRYPDLPLSAVNDIVLIEKIPEPEPEPTPAAPVAEGAAPVADGAAPVADGAAPVADGAAPVADGAAPVAAPVEAAPTPAPAAAPAPAPAAPKPAPKPADDIFTF